MNKRAYHSGMIAFLLSGICSVSAGVIVSLLQDRYHLNYSFAGTLLSIMSIGNMAALLASGVLPGFLGERATTLMLSIGAFVGYLITAMTGNALCLLLAFLAIGVCKGCAANKCTILVGQNTTDRPRAMNLMNAFFAVGALLCPLLIVGLQRLGPAFPMMGVSLAGLCLWVVFLFSGLHGKAKATEAAAKKADYAFLKNTLFWLLALLLFCQNAAEYVVNGWIVTYYKSERILTGALASYTVTVQWGLTLIARLLLAFALKIRKPYKALFVMGIGLTVMYGMLLVMKTPIPALIALGLFSFAIAGVYPLTVAGIGEMTSSASVGVLLSFAGLGGVIFPWLVGLIADAAGMRAGMAVNLIPCAGLIVLPLLIGKEKMTDSV